MPELNYDSSTSHTRVNTDENLVDPKVINILLVGTTSGSIHISLFGLFECAVIDLTEMLSEPCEILNVHMANNLSYLYAIVKTTEDHQIKVITLKTNIFRSHCNELHLIAYKHGKIISLLNYLEGTIASIEQAWETILMEMDSKLESFASSAPEGAVAADFLDLLLFGFPSYDLDIFLYADLTEKGLRKLGHSIECSYSNIQKLVLKHLAKVGQNISYYLVELRGMARMEFRYKVLGLHENLATKAISAAGSFLIKGAEVQQVIDNSMRNYKAFFRWLYVIILRGNDEHVPPEISKVSQQDVTFIGEFLKNFEALPKDSKQSGRSKYFHLERLGQYLVDANLDVPLDVSVNPWNQFITSRPELTDLIIPHNLNTSLIQEHKSILTTINDLFKGPKESISNLLEHNNTLTLLQIQNTKNLSVTMKNFDQNITFLALSDKSNPYQLNIFEINTQDSIIKAGKFYFRDEEKLKIIDLQFYTSNILSVLLQAENEKSVFGQFSIASARGLLSVCNVTDNLVDYLKDLTDINACGVPISTALKVLDNCVANSFAVSGNRKVSVILMENLRSVCLYEMEVEEDDEEEDGDVTASTTKEGDLSLMQDGIEQMTE